MELLKYYSANLGHNFVFSLQKGGKKKKDNKLTHFFRINRIHIL